MRKLLKQITAATKDENFMHMIESIEVLVSKVLSIFLVLVILVAITDLGFFLFKELFSMHSSKPFNENLLNVFGLFLDVLIALEILENITSYLRKHVFQVELVIATSLIAVSRKIIILDLDKVKGTDILGLGVTIFALAVSYWIIRHTNTKNPN